MMVLHIQTSLSLSWIEGTLEVDSKMRNALWITYHSLLILTDCGRFSLDAAQGNLKRQSRQVLYKFLTETHKGFSTPYEFLFIPIITNCEKKRKMVFRTQDQSDEITSISCLWDKPPCEQSLVLSLAMRRRKAGSTYIASNLLVRSPQPIRLD